MSTRLGIELSAAACRLVEIEGRVRPAGGAEPRVRSFAVLPPSGPETDAMLASLKGRHAAVVVWGPPSEHRQVVVTPASYEAMRREAVAALATLGLKTSTALADIAPVGETKETTRRPVVVALAAADPMLDAIQPLVAAGIHVRSLATPAMALAAMARIRRGFAALGGAIEAYVAVEETSTCIALLRDGALAIARELPWGYVDDGPRGALRARDDIAQRLAAELLQYLEAVGSPAAAQVCVCGGVPELRSMAATLTERLDIEVEPLDSLFGIDQSQPPEPADDFRERVAELRLAWVAAADWPPFLNLLRARRRERSRRMLGAAAIAAGVIAGVGGAWQMARTDWARAIVPHGAPAARTASIPRPSAPTRPSAMPRPAAPRPSTLAPAPATAPAVKPPAPRPALASRSLVPAAPLARVVRPPAVTLTADLRQSPPAPAPAPPAPVSRAAAPPVVARQSAPPPHTTPPAPQAAARTPPPAAPRPTPTAPVPARPQAQPEPPRSALPQAPSSPQREAAAPRPVTPAAAPPRPVKPEPVTPFDASLETILYSSDRKLAIVDGRIVGIGDEVRSARIVEITPTTVMLRDSQGRLRRLALGGLRQ